MDSMEISTYDKINFENEIRELFNINNIPDAFPTHYSFNDILNWFNNQSFVIGISRDGVSISKNKISNKITNLTRSQFLYIMLMICYCGIRTSSNMFNEVIYEDVYDMFKKLHDSNFGRDDILWKDRHGKSQ